MDNHNFELLLDSTSFATDNVVIHRMKARERMGQLFEVELQVVTEGEPSLEIDEVIGGDASLVLSADGHPVRKLHGMVTRAQELETLGTDRSVYALTLGPLFWRATLVETLDIHLDKSVPEVIAASMERLGLSSGADYQLKLSGYPKRELIVQFRETDLSFASRLCEHLGIFFYFDHGAEQSTMVFGDDVSAYRAIDGDDAVPFMAHGEQRGVFELQYMRNLIPGTYVCRDYNDQTPALELHCQHGLDEGFAGGIIEYGGDFTTTGEGERLVRARAEESLCRYGVYTGRSADPRFAPGHTFMLEDHPRHARRLVLLDVEHEASQDVGGWGASAEKGYQNRFTAIAAERTYRPPRTTPVPRIHGVMSGVVETFQGAIEPTARIDDQGRYTVRFLFDTAAPGERKASCPVRMMQPSAGPGYGMHFPLKPGIEVAIVFLDGNPDRPLIVGAVPNPITPTPVNAPVATKSRIKTRSGILIEFDDKTRGIGK